MKKNVYHKNKIINYFEGFRRYLLFEDKKTGRSKVYASLWSVFFGILISSIIYMIIGNTGSSPRGTSLFSFISYMIDFSLLRDINRTDLLLYFIFFGFAGLGVSLAFKSGLFNIGVAGQMTMPGIIFFSVLILSRVKPSELNPSFLIGMLFIFIIGGFITGSISGFLKAYFNVHEVISTIFLNWIVTYLSQWLFTRVNGVFGGSEVASWFDDIGGTAKIFIAEDQIYSFIYFGFAFLIILSAVIWYIYAKTTLGYKIKMVGLNKTNAKYVGVNEKLMTVFVMAASGALVAFGGFFYIILKDGRLTGEPSPITIGFDSIAIAMIALNSPIGVLFSSFLYSIIYTSRTLFQTLQGSEKLENEFFVLLNGIIIFVTALSLIFYKFKPLRSIFKQCYLATNKEYWLNFKTYHISKFKYVIPERIKLFKKYLQNLILKFKFKQKEKEYQNYVLEKISKSKNYSNGELMNMYDSLSKSKFEHLKEKENFGLHEYTDALSKYKNQKSGRKNNFKLIKEKIFLSYLSSIKNNYMKKYNISEGEE
ncbi:ABC transporter permease [Mycoplasmopsis felis]|uniref:ABC transporter permease n=1 Tax=Mycoplasmopsis felis TaxID=33923 RepID=UPI002AF6AB1E|nr:ABC transporter permease [Mycoplasmopsis felis]WQQ01688.1 ABC transporter permease [Mycoplasmopsis felis]